VPPSLELLLLLSLHKSSYEYSAMVEIASRVPRNLSLASISDRVKSTGSTPWPFEPEFHFGFENRAIVHPLACSRYGKAIFFGGILNGFSSSRKRVQLNFLVRDSRPGGVQTSTFNGQIRVWKSVEPTASTGFMERAMGIEQIRMNQTKGVTTRFSVQLESNGVRSRMNVNFGHRRGVSAWDREGKGVCDGRRIIKHGLRKNSFRQLPNLLVARAAAVRMD